MKSFLLRYRSIQKKISNVIFNSIINFFLKNEKKYEINIRFNLMKKKRWYVILFFFQFFLRKIYYSKIKLDIRDSINIFSFRVWIVLKKKNKKWADYHHNKFQKYIMNWFWTDLDTSIDDGWSDCISTLTFIVKLLLL